MKLEMIPGMLVWICTTSYGVLLVAAYLHEANFF